LGKFLVDIGELAQSLATPFQQPDLSKFSPMISIVGVPYAGIIKKFINFELKIILLIILLFMNS